MSWVTAVVGLAIWDEDYPKLKKTIKSLSPDLKETFKISDEKYRLFYWHGADLLKFDNLKEKLEDIRHSLVTLTEDGNINEDIQPQDNRGVDDEFYYLIGWYGGIIINGKKIL